MVSNMCQPSLLPKKQRNQSQLLKRVKIISCQRSISTSALPRELAAGNIKPGEQQVLLGEKAATLTGDQFVQIPLSWLRKLMQHTDQHKDSAASETCTDTPAHCEETGNSTRKPSSRMQWLTPHLRKVHKLHTTKINALLATLESYRRRKPDS